MMMILCVLSALFLSVSDEVSDEANVRFYSVFSHGRPLLNKVYKGRVK